MIKIKNTPQLAGITMMGDYEDLQNLYNAIINYTELYFSHQDNVNAEHCHECVLGLCYDIRHAFQGDRGCESIENNASRFGAMRGVVFKISKDEERSIKATRAAFSKGNLYFTVDILYPWAVYYMYTLQAITDDLIYDSWFNDNTNFFQTDYDKYQAEKDASLIRYFVQLLWEVFSLEISDKVIDTIRSYVGIYSRHDYYMAYPDMYIEWLCTYWVKAAASRKNRKTLLPLLLLELSSIDEEDEEDIRYELDQARVILQKYECKDPKNLASVNNDEEEGISNNPDGAETMKCDFDKKDKTAEGSDPDETETGSRPEDTTVASISKSLQERALACLQMYETQISQAREMFTPPYKTMYEYMDRIDAFVKEHGSFYRDTYDEYLDGIFGEMDWDQLEW